MAGVSVLRRLSCGVAVAVSLFAGNAVAKEIEVRKSTVAQGGKGVGLELGLGMTFLGEEAALLGSYHFGDNKFYAGPRLFLTRAFSPVEDPYGFLLGYQRYLGEGAFRSVFGPEYHITSFRNNIDYSAHEILWNYGVEWEFAPRTFVLNSFGFGLLIEELENGSIVELNGLLKLSLGYRF